jgi:hypothetical protein
MTTEKTKPKPEPELVKTTVSFPISPSGPYRTEVEGDTTVGAIRQDAMTHFGVAEDGQHAYYLTHSGAKIADEATIADVAGEAKAVKFTLVKELIQG